MIYLCHSCYKHQAYGGRCYEFGKLLKTRFSFLSNSAVIIAKQQNITAIVVNSLFSILLCTRVDAKYTTTIILCIHHVRTINPQLAEDLDVVYYVYLDPFLSAVRISPEIALILKIF